MSGTTLKNDPSSWYLEGFVDASRSSWRTVIHSLPLVVGREESADLQLRSPKVSHRHAEIYFNRGLRVRDLGSTNGTYVNGRRVRGTHRLRTGDVIRFANLELRLASYRTPPSTGTKALTTEDLKEFLAEQGEDFVRLLETRSIRPLFQPLFDLRRLTVVGYEPLCRGKPRGLRDRARRALLHRRAAGARDRAESAVPQRGRPRGGGATRAAESLRQHPPE